MYVRTYIVCLLLYTRIQWGNAFSPFHRSIASRTSTSVRSSFLSSPLCPSSHLQGSPLYLLLAVVCVHSRRLLLLLLFLFLFIAIEARGRWALALHSPRVQLRACVRGLFLSSVLRILSHVWPTAAAAAATASRSSLAIAVRLLLLLPRTSIWRRKKGERRERSPTKSRRSHHLAPHGKLQSKGRRFSRSLSHSPFASPTLLSTSSIDSQKRIDIREEDRARETNVCGKQNEKEDKGKSDPDLMDVMWPRQQNKKVLCFYLWETFANTDRKWIVTRILCREKKANNNNSSSSRCAVNNSTSKKVKAMTTDLHTKVKASRKNNLVPAPHLLPSPPLHPSSTTTVTKRCSRTPSRRTTWSTRSRCCARRRTSCRSRSWPRRARVPKGSKSDFSAVGPIPFVIPWTWFRRPSRITNINFCTRRPVTATLQHRSILLLLLLLLLLRLLLLLFWPHRRALRISRSQRQHHPISILWTDTTTIQFLQQMKTIEKQPQGKKTKKRWRLKMTAEIVHHQAQTQSGRFAILVVSLESIWVKERARNL